MADVIDVFSADLLPGSRLAKLYAPIIYQMPGELLDAS